LPIPGRWVDSELAICKSAVLIIHIGLLVSHFYSNRFFVVGSVSNGTYPRVLNLRVHIVRLPGFVEQEPKPAIIFLRPPASDCDAFLSFRAPADTSPVSGFPTDPNKLSTSSSTSGVKSNTPIKLSQQHLPRHTRLLLDFYTLDTIPLPFCFAVVPPSLTSVDNTPAPTDDLS
jgi:hypothetical protein